MEDESLSNCDGTSLNRRRFIAGGGGVSAVLLAGCVGDDEVSNGDPSGGDQEMSGDGTRDDSDDEGNGNGTDSGSDDGGRDEETGTFRLLISDQPAAIDDFDRLEVTLEEARIFGGPDDAGEEDNGNDDNDDQGGEADETGDDGEDAPGQRGFFFIDLDGATVDLTEVIGEKAIDVFDGELPAGRYTKIELYPEDVEGIVDGNEVTVHVPSDKLQITKPFEVEAGETLSFVFDINVVRRGNTGEYNLTPVIAESGVAGEDVDVDEVDGDGDDADSDDGNGEADGDDAEADDGDGAGPPDDAGDGAGPPDDAGPDDDAGN